MRYHDSEEMRRLTAHGLQFGTHADLHAMVSTRIYGLMSLTGWVGSHPVDGDDMPMLLLYPASGTSSTANRNDSVRHDRTSASDIMSTLRELFTTWGLGIGSTVENPVLDKEDGHPLEFRVKRRWMTTQEYKAAGLRQKALTGSGGLVGVPGMKGEAIDLNREWVAAADARRQCVVFFSPVPWTGPAGTHPEARWGLTPLDTYTDHHGHNMAAALVPITYE
ncbi:hypothetical protein AB0G83_07480 [Streptomyces klenkii]|uniref:hypothetical protein n=1 Tax=Streptomyces klenkii TaxID=1420899 RepID=UPI0033F81DCC